MSHDDAHILVVDDNPATRYSTARILKSAGWKVSEAETGNQALTLVEQEVDIVVLDVNLPDINGFDVCRRVREMEKLKRLPVIHLSATFVKDVDRVHGLEAGADGYLTHPVEPPVLVATVKAFLRARRAEIDRERILLSERIARAEAEHANRIKDDFLATLSHELRTPLHAMLGWAQILKMGKSTPEEIAEGLDAIERNAQAQSQMIADLLDIARITSGKLRLDVQPLNLSVTVEEALATVMPAADAKGIRIVKIFDSAAGTTSGDPSRLQQVVWNLVNNAVKFTPPGGRIEVRLERIDSHVEIAVTDDGQGISAELLPRIFDRFHQGDASTTRHHGGLGLGLAIVKQLVELHGGTVRAESAGQSRGSRFIVTLPVSPAGPRPREPGQGLAALPLLHARPEVPVRLDNVRILIVDDDADARRMLPKILAGTGAIVKGAANVGEALETLEAFKPHVLVSDLGMPDQDGFDLIRKVRAGGHTVQELPAIALTGFARPEDHRRALLAGFQFHLAKPVDPAELTTAIATLVGRARA